MDVAIKNKRVGTDLTDGSVFRTLILFSIPLIMSNLVQQMYTIVDLMVIGKFAGSAGTVGVAVGGEIADLLTPVATALAGAGRSILPSWPVREKKNGSRKPWEHS